jgi:hypothetical protein
MSTSSLSPELRAMLDDMFRAARARRALAEPKPPKLTLAASSEGKPDEAVVPLEGEDLERVKSALAGRRTVINGDEVVFDKIAMRG